MKRINVEIWRCFNVEIWRCFNVEYDVVLTLKLLRLDFEMTLKMCCFSDVESITLFQRWKLVAQRRDLKSTLKQRWNNEVCWLGTFFHIIRPLEKRRLTSHYPILQYLVLYNLNVIDQTQTILSDFWHRVTDITSFGKRLESSLGHTLNFCPNLVLYRFKNMYVKESLSPSSTVILSTNKGGSRAKLISSRRTR